MPINAVEWITRTKNSGVLIVAIMMVAPVVRVVRVVMIVGLSYGTRAYNPEYRHYAYQR